MDAPTLVCIDIQMGFLDTKYWGAERNNPNAEEVCGTLLRAWRNLGLSIIHIQHSSTDSASILNRSNPGFAFNPQAQPRGQEPVITKSVNSGFIGTDLKATLDARNASDLVVIGLTTDHCVSTTTRMAGNLGYNTFVVSDATATFGRRGPDGQYYSADTIHSTALASLHGEFATVLDSNSVIQMLEP